MLLKQKRGVRLVLFSFLFCTGKFNTCAYYQYSTACLFCALPFSPLLLYYYCLFFFCVVSPPLVLSTEFI